MVEDGGKAGDVYVAEAPHGDLPGGGRGGQAEEAQKRVALGQQVIRIRVKAVAPLQMSDKLQVDDFESGAYICWI